MPKKKITSPDEPITCNLCDFRIIETYARNNTKCPKCSWKIGKAATFMDKDTYAYRLAREYEDKVLVKSLFSLDGETTTTTTKRKRRTKAEMETAALAKRKKK